MLQSHHLEVITHLPTDCLVTDHTGVVVAASQALLNSLGLEGDQLVGLPIAERVPEPDREAVDHLRQRCLERSGQTVRCEHRLLHADGSEIVFHAAGTAYTPSDGAGNTADSLFVWSAPTRHLVAPSPVDGRAHLDPLRLAALELLADGAAPRRVFDAVVDMLTSLMGGGALICATSSSGAIEVVAAGPVSEPVGRVVPETVFPDGAPALRVVPDIESDVGLATLCAECTTGETQAWLLPVIEPGRATGSRPALIILQPPGRLLGRQDHEVVAAALSLINATEQRRRESAQLSQINRVDSLTGLPTRAAFLDAVAERLSCGPPGDVGCVTSVLFLSVALGEVNATWGHRAGDRVIVEFARRISEIAGPNGIVARWDGENFSVLLCGADPMQTARDTLAALQTPVDTSSGVVRPEVHIGLSEWRNGETPDTLVHKAHTAMMLAKEPDAGRIAHFDRSDSTNGVHRIELRRQLHSCLERHELVLDWQPKISLATGEIRGAEVLLRWRHPDHGLLRPDQFIALAEETGVIVDIGAWVLREALEQAAAWRDSDLITDDFMVSINMSARQLWSDDLEAALDEGLAATGWPPSSVILELTETVLATELNSFASVLANLKARGVLLAADDFGTGYSALAYLDELPLDVLKIDKAFVARLRADGTGSQAVTAVMSIARSAGLTTWGEGVETAQQLDGLRRIGCDWAQGYLIARPVTPLVFAGLLETGISV